MRNETPRLALPTGTRQPATSKTTRRINHQECYSDGAACTNQAESFFSRMRRAEIGIHHHIRLRTHKSVGIIGTF
jgi:hypothetical protein